MQFAGIDFTAAKERITVLMEVQKEEDQIQQANVAFIPMLDGDIARSIKTFYWTEPQHGRDTWWGARCVLLLFWLAFKQRVTLNSRY